jgi:polar amino acid transport system substrate-binding protein
MNDIENVRTQIAPSGVLRVGINLGNPVIAQPGKDDGEPGGVGPSLARELARRLGLPIAFTTYETAGLVAAAVKQGGLDVVFLAIDPERAVDIDFTDAYVHIEGTYMVRQDSPLRSIDDVDREGVRVAVGLKTAYDLFLSRHLKQAQLLRFPTSKAAIEQFLAENLEAVAGVKQPLDAVVSKTSGLQVMAGNFMVIRQASGVPKGRQLAQGYLAEFIEEAKSSGFVERSLAQSGVQATVAPPRAK